MKTPDKGEATWTLLYDIVCTDLCQDDDPSIFIEEQASVLSSALAILSAIFASHVEKYSEIEQSEFSKFWKRLRFGFGEK